MSASRKKYVRRVVSGKVDKKKSTPNTYRIRLSDCAKVYDRSVFIIDPQEIRPPKAAVVEFRNHSKVLEHPCITFLVPGFDGSAFTLRNIAAAISGNVWGFQCPPEAPIDSVRSLAKYYIEKMREIQKDGMYTVIGYSFGTCVAFEMARLLRKEGKIVNVCFLDSSPVFVKLQSSFIGEGIENPTLDSTYPIALAGYIHSMNPKISFQEAKVMMLAKANKKKMMQKLLKVVGSVTKCRKSAVELSADMFAKKLWAAYSYLPHQTFSGRILLIKGMQSRQLINIPDRYRDDYGIRLLCHNRHFLETREILGDHMSILNRERAFVTALTFRSWRVMLDRDQENYPKISRKRKVFKYINEKFVYAERRIVRSAPPQESTTGKDQPSDNNGSTDASAEVPDNIDPATGSTNVPVDVPAVVPAAVPDDVIFAVPFPVPGAARVAAPVIAPVSVPVVAPVAVPAVAPVAVPVVAPFTAHAAVPVFTRIYVPLTAQMSVPVVPPTLPVTVPPNTAGKSTNPDTHPESALIDEMDFTIDEADSSIEFSD